VGILKQKAIGIIEKMPERKIAQIIDFLEYINENNKEISNESKIKSKSLKGCLEQYKDINKIPEEETAWQEMVRENHEDN